jgi:mannose-1-phosphate guanylyltransferase/mannose-6-phosphate isomerase
MTGRPIVPVILSGGAGSRLWPASRSRTPKQLLPLVDERTMFLTTVLRTAPIPFATTPVIVCNETQRPGIERELASVGLTDAALILEPVGRKTAPAVAVAALHLTPDGADPILFVMPADHVIRNEEAFAEAVALGAEVAEEGYLLTFGVDPVSPETGYGYIRFGEELAEGVRVVEEFREKPDAATAEAYLATGRYLWNSGMFMFKASRFLTELEAYAPDVLAAARLAIAKCVTDGAALHLDAVSFASAPSISIDYAVMEHTASAAVIPVRTGWSDVGSWAALWKLGEPDEHGNVVVGDVELVDVNNSYLRSSNRLIAAIGLDDIVVVDTSDAVLIAKRDRSQDVKTIVDRLKASGRTEVDTDGGETHTWGDVSVLVVSPASRVARLDFEPAASTPMGSDADHSKRWIVVEGVGIAHIQGAATSLAEGSAVVVPPGADHRLENGSGTAVLKVIEIAVDTGVDGDSGSDR